MADWTEAAVREALACVEGAEWGLCSVTESIGFEAVTVESPSRPRIEVESWHGDGSIKARWHGPDTQEGWDDETVESRRLSPRRPDEVPAILSVLRALVIATHGPEAWPWAMRDAKRKGPVVHYGTFEGGPGWWETHVEDRDGAYYEIGRDGEEMVAVDDDGVATLA